MRQLLGREEQGEKKSDNSQQGCYRKGPENKDYLENEDLDGFSRYP